MTTHIEDIVPLLVATRGVVVLVLRNPVESGKWKVEIVVYVYNRGCPSSH
jgi:hypothetical protein